MTTDQNNNFHSSGLAQEVDQLMDILYAGGVNNPMDSIEQISYLLFIKLLWEKDQDWKIIDPNHQGLFTGEWERYEWGRISNLTGDELFNTLRDVIEKLEELPGLTDTGRLLFRQSTLKILDRPTLRAVVQGVHQMGLNSQGVNDPKGDMYEYLLSKLTTSGTNGQFRTPRHIIDLIVQVVDPKPDERICDPAAGSAGFLLAAHDHILKNNTSQSDLDRGEITGSQLSASQWTFLEEQAYTGFDNDANMVKFGIMNLYLHNLEKARFQMHNSVTTTLGGAYPGQSFDVILANPPFSGSVQKESILSDLNHGLDTRATELLFCKWFIDHLRDGGRAAVIVPDGVLTGSSKAHRFVKKTLIDDINLEAVISLPAGCFRPYAGVSTTILIYTNRSPLPGSDVWFYDMRSDGWSLDTRRQPLLEFSKLGVNPSEELTDEEHRNNNLPDVVKRWKLREESEKQRTRIHQSFCVPKTEIVSNDYDLSFNRYNEVVHEEINYPRPSDLVTDILEIEKELQVKLQEFKELFDDKVP